LNFLRLLLGSGDLLGRKLNKLLQHEL
jgi:hypothetical protein